MGGRWLISRLLMPNTNSLPAKYVWATKLARVAVLVTNHLACFRLVILVPNVLTPTERWFC